MTTVTLTTAPSDVMAAASRTGLASRIQNQSHRDMKVWLNNSPTPPDPSALEPDFVCKPWIDFAVDGTQKVWCQTGDTTKVSVAAQTFS